MSIWSAKEFDTWIKKNDGTNPNVFYLSLDKPITYEQSIIITKLRELEYLKMHCYTGQSLPFNFEILENLVFLTISAQSESESFESFPHQICRLTNLQHLKISGHCFTSINDSIGNLENLITLDLSHNKLSEIPPNLSRLKRLQKLNLSFNSCINIDPALQIDSLLSLDLSGVDIITFRENIQFPESLTKFSYSQSIPNYLKDMWISRLPEVDYNAFQTSVFNTLRKEGLEIMQDELREKN